MASSIPQRQVKFSSSSKANSIQPSSPGLETVGSDASALTIHHSVVSSQPSRSILGMSRPMAAIIGTLLFGTMGAGVWGWIQLPGLNEQIEELEEQVNRLGFEVDRLSSVADELEHENDRYETLNDQLNQSILDLNRVNMEFQQSVAQLNGTVSDLEMINEDLQQENEAYSALNRELEAIVSFLNNTAGEINKTFEEITAFLAEQIQTNRVLVLQILESSYLQQTNFWDCAFRDVFRGEPFVENENLVIVSSRLSEVLSYVEERVLSILCLDAENFEEFLSSSYSLDFLTANQLYQGVAEYTRQAMRHYFPNPGDELGLTQQNWADAGYQCENLAVPFSFDIAS